MWRHQFLCCCSWASRVLFSGALMCLALRETLVTTCLSSSTNLVFSCPSSEPMLGSTTRTENRGCRHPACRTSCVRLSTSATRSPTTCTRCSIPRAQRDYQSCGPCGRSSRRKRRCSTLRTSLCTETIFWWLRKSATLPTSRTPQTTPGR